MVNKKVIITLFELSDNYKSLTLKQLPKFDPEDLKAILFKSNINIEYIINDLDLNKKKQNNTPIKDGTLPICWNCCQEGIKQMYKCTLIFQKKKVQKKKQEKKYFKVNICFSFATYINFFMDLLVTWRYILTILKNIEIE